MSWAVNPLNFGRWRKTETWIWKASGIDKAISDSICVKICYDIRICRVIVFSYTGRKNKYNQKETKGMMMQSACKWREKRLLLKTERRLNENRRFEISILLAVNIWVFESERW
jgi:hypothetical protein